MQEMLFLLWVHIEADCLSVSTSDCKNPFRFRMDKSSLNLSRLCSGAQGLKRTSRFTKARRTSCALDFWYFFSLALKSTHSLYRHMIFIPQRNDLQ